MHTLPNLFRTPWLLHCVYTSRSFMFTVRAFVHTNLMTTQFLLHNPIACFFMYTFAIPCPDLTTGNFLLAVLILYLILFRIFTLPGFLRWTGMNLSEFRCSQHMYSLHVTPAFLLWSCLTIYLHFIRISIYIVTCPSPHEHQACFFPLYNPYLFPHICSTFLSIFTMFATPYTPFPFSHIQPAPSNMYSLYANRITKCGTYLLLWDKYSVLYHVLLWIIWIVSPLQTLAPLTHLTQIHRPTTISTHSYLIYPTTQPFPFNPPHHTTPLPYHISLPSHSTNALQHLTSFHPTISNSFRNFDPPPFLPISPYCTSSPALPTAFPS